MSALVAAFCGRLARCLVLIAAIALPSPSLGQTGGDIGARIVEAVGEGRNAMAEGDGSTALSAFGEALNLLVRAGQGESANAAFLRNEIAMAARMAGLLNIAQESAEAAVRLAETLDLPAEQAALYHYNLGLVQYDQADFGPAEAAHTEAIQLARRTGDGALRVAALRERGQTYQALGQYTAAEVDWSAALDGLKETDGAGSETLALHRSLVGLELLRQDVRAGASALGALKTREFESGLPEPGSPATRVLEARLLIAEGRLPPAEAILQDVLDGLDDDDGLLRASVHYNLAEIEFARGRYPASDRANLRAEAIYAETLGPGHMLVLQTTLRRAILYQESGNSDAALDLYNALLMQTAAELGRGHLFYAETLIERSRALTRAGRGAEAVADIEGLLAGRIHGRARQLAISALGLIQFEREAYSAARPLLQEAVAVWRSGAFGFADAPPTMIALAELELIDGNLAAAEDLATAMSDLLVARGAAAIDRLSEARRVRAEVRKRRGDREGALELAQANIGTARDQILWMARTGAATANYSASQVRAQIGQYLVLAWPDDDVRIVSGAPAAEPLFEAIQLLHLNDTSAAVLGTYAALRDDPTGIYAAREALAADLRAAQAQFLAISREAGTTGEALAGLRIRISDLEKALAEAEARLVTDAPGISEVLSPRPVSVADIQRNLGAGEALWMQASFAERSYLVWVTPDSVRIARSDLTLAALRTAVTQVRTTLEFDWSQPMPEFDVVAAAGLYRALFGDFDDAMAEQALIHLVPDAAAQQISLATLVMGRRDGSPVAEGQNPREMRFLGHAVALSVLPSPQVLAVHAATPGAEDQAGRLVGFGDPVLEGTGVAGSRALEQAFDGVSGMADPTTLRSLFAPLPLSRIELEELREITGADKATLYLDSGATEESVRRASYEGVKTVVFATHALVTGDFAGLVEPALVMTPPDSPTPTDDGLLLASEIASLNLDAELVILSACNTGAPSERDGAPGLSGLARAFWLAGARSMLVSHWQISSGSARLITPHFFETYVTTSGLSRPEALRQTMVWVVETFDNDVAAHPAFWGAFTVVGTG